MTAVYILHMTRASAVSACVWFHATHPPASVICGQFRLNVEKSQNPNEMAAFGVDMFRFGDRSCQLSFEEKYGGGGRRYDAAQENKRTQTKIDTTRPCPHIYRSQAGLVAVPTMAMMVDHQVVVVAVMA